MGLTTPYLLFPCVIARWGSLQVVSSAHHRASTELSITKLMVFLMVSRFSRVWKMKLISSLQLSLIIEWE